MNKKSKIFVAGHNGMVGSAIIRQLQSKGYENIVTQNRDKLDLVDKSFEVVKESENYLIIEIKSDEN